MRTLHVELNPQHAVAFSPDSKRVVSVSWDDVVQIWDAETGAEVSSVMLLLLYYSRPRVE